MHTAIILSDHINLANGIGNFANPLPAFRKESDCARLDVDVFAVIALISAPARQKMAKLIAGDVTTPGSWRAIPDPGLRTAILVAPQ